MRNERSGTARMKGVVGRIKSAWPGARHGGNSGDDTSDSGNCTNQRWASAGKIHAALSGVNDSPRGSGSKPGHETNPGSVMVGSIAGSAKEPVRLSVAATEAL